MMLSSIQNSPFRYLGVYSNARAKEITANVIRIKAFCKVGKTVEFPSDMTAVMPSVVRSEQQTGEMANRLILPKDKLRYSLTWFINITENDEKALALVREGETERAISSLRGISHFSAFFNRGVASFLVGKDIDGIKAILRVVHDPSFRQQFVNAVCGSLFEISELELARMFIDELHADIPALMLTRLLRQEGIPVSDRQYINDKITERAEAYIRNKLNAFLPASATMKDAMQLFDDCVPYIANMREAQGKGGMSYLRFSTQVEQAVLNVVINEVNQCMSKVRVPTSYIAHITMRTELTFTLNQAWSIMSKLDSLDLEISARERLNRQKDTLANIFQQLDLTIPKMDVFQLLTERDLFEACRKKEQYEDYVKRFPSGDYMKKAQEKIAEFEAQEAEARRQLRERIGGCQTAEDMSDILPSCKDEETRCLAEERYFSLCATKSDFRLYLEDFGDYGLYAQEAKSHLRLELWMKKVKEVVMENKWWTAAVVIALVAIAYGGFTKGLEGLSHAFVLMGFLFGGSTIIQVNRHEEGDGCAPVFVTIALAAVCFLIGAGFNSWNKHQQHEREEAAAYDSLMKEPSQFACDYFLEKYPESERKEDVMAIYYQYAYAGGLETLTPFFSKFVGTPWGDKANLRRKEICDSLYDIANVEGSISAWQRYQEVVPTDFLADSQEKIDSIENLRWNTDESAWKSANEDGTAAAYQKYIDMYPSGKYKRQADRKLIDIQVNDIMSGSHGSLPSMDRVRYSSGITSVVTVKNNTSYTMTLLYSGPDSKRLILSPQQESSINLKNGTYRVAASVDASDIRNYAGSESLQGGSYNVEYYIVTTTRPRFGY